MALRRLTLATMRAFWPRKVGCSHSKRSSLNRIRRVKVTSLLVMPPLLKSKVAESVVVLHLLYFGVADSAPEGNFMMCNGGDGGVNAGGRLAQLLAQGWTGC